MAFACFNNHVHAKSLFFLFILIKQLKRQIPLIQKFTLNVTKNRAMSRYKFNSKRHHFMLFYRAACEI